MDPLLSQEPSISKTTLLVTFELPKTHTCARLLVMLWCLEEVVFKVQTSNLSRKAIPNTCTLKHRILF